MGEGSIWIRVTMVRNRGLTLLLSSCLEIISALGCIKPPVGTNTGTQGLHFTLGLKSTPGKGSSNQGSDPKGQKYLLAPQLHNQPPPFLFRAKLQI